MRAAWRNNMSDAPFISKSKLLWGLQCRNLLWTAYNAKDLIPASDAATRGHFRPRCCDLLPEFRSWFRQVEPKVVDLLLPFRGFRYYHPAQHGSASMKAVLPALTGRGYEHLAIQKSGTASLEFMRVTHGDVAAEERQRVGHELEKYCGLDTEGMIWIADALRQLVS